MSQEILLGCVCIGSYLFAAQRYSLWLMIPQLAPRDAPPGLRTKSQRLLLALACLAAAAVSALGLYLCFWWPEQWQAGFVVILLGLVVLAPVTVTEVRFRRSLQSHWQSGQPD